MSDQSSSTEPDELAGTADKILALRALARLGALDLVAVLGLDGSG
ncbi:hypothetical protein [Pimelobacter simplex]